MWQKPIYKLHLPTSTGMCDIDGSFLGQSANLSCHV